MSNSISGKIYRTGPLLKTKRRNEKLLVQESFLGPIPLLVRESLLAPIPLLVRESLLAPIPRGILSPVTRDGNPYPGRSRWESRSSEIFTGQVRYSRPRGEMKNRDPPGRQADPGHKGRQVMFAVSSEQRSLLVRESLLAPIPRGILSPVTRDGNPYPGRSRWESRSSEIFTGQVRYSRPRGEMKNRDPPGRQADPGHKGR